MSRKTLEPSVGLPRHHAGCATGTPRQKGGYRRTASRWDAIRNVVQYRAGSPSLSDVKGVGRPTESSHFIFWSERQCHRVSLSAAPQGSQETDLAHNSGTEVGIPGNRTFENA